MAGVIATMVLFPNGLPGSASQKTITVRASGTSYAYPAQGTVYLSVNGTGQTPGIATDNISLSLAKLNLTISKYANSTGIKTVSYSFAKIYNSSLYSATEQVEVDLPINNVSPLLGSVSSIKGISVYSASSKLSQQQTSQLIKSALSAAMANATSQAEAIGNTSSVTPENITVDSYYIYPIYPGGVFAGQSALQSQQNPAFFAGTQSVTEIVSVVFRHG